MMPRLGRSAFSLAMVVSAMSLALLLLSAVPPERAGATCLLQDGTPSLINCAKITIVKQITGESVPRASVDAAVAKSI